MKPIPRLQPITETPRPLNGRLWELIRKEIDGTASSDEIAELNAICAANEREEG